MPDDFALWKAAQDAKKKAKEKKDEADKLKKARDLAWDQYTDAYNAWVQWGKGQDNPAERQKWIVPLEKARADWDKAADDWEKALDASTNADRAAIAAVNAFNQALPPDVPLMPMPPWL